MAATLPAIHQGQRMQSGGGRQPIQITSGRSSNPKSPSMIIATGVTKRSQGKRDREMEQKKAALRSQQPRLDKMQTSKYRNTSKHNMFLEMLQEGYHQSFIELFTLIKQQNAERLAAGPESSIWTKVLLENEQDKLETLKLYLTQAEAASRRNDSSTVYKCQYQLARYFQGTGTGDKWLSDHFFEACLNTASNVKDEGKMAAEGHCNVGLAMEETGDNVAATENFEKFHELTKEKLDWSFEDGTTMHLQACIHLSRIYTKVAHQHEEAQSYTEYQEYLQKAYDMAEEAGDRKILGEASYRLGLAFQKNGDCETALKYLNGYLDTCQSLGDNEGFGIACEAIAISYESQGKVEESIKYLEMFVNVAEKSKNDKAMSQACSNLGSMYNTLGRYEQATEYYNKSYNIARAMNDSDTISSSRVLFGVAAAHKMLENITYHMEIASGSIPATLRLLDWKDNRNEEFDKPIPDGSEKQETGKSELGEDDQTNDAENNTGSQTENAEENRPNSRPGSTQ